MIVIGELRDNESVSLALTAAETGHIVLGTLNSTSARQGDRPRPVVVPGRRAGPGARRRCRESLKFVIAQRLLPSKEPRKQVACFEVLSNTMAVANMIREEKTYQIPSAMQIGRSQGMQTFDDALRGLLVGGRPHHAARPPTGRPPRRRTSRRYLPGGGRRRAAPGHRRRPAEAQEAVSTTPASGRPRRSTASCG